MKTGNVKPTRGYGLLEGFLAKKRAKIANHLMPMESRKGRLLDIGCGTYPYFLENTHFREKVGVDKVIDKNCPVVSRFVWKMAFPGIHGY